MPPLKIRTLVFLLLFISHYSKGQTNVDSLLNVLDYTLKNKAHYQKKKDQKIDLLKEQLPGKSAKEQFDLNKSIIDEYQYYISDSAFEYLDRNKIIAIDNRNSKWKFETQIQQARLLSSVGIFSESQKLLDSIPSGALDDSLKLLYYTAQEELYVHLLDFINDSRFKTIYNSQLIKYRDSALTYLQPNSAEFYFWKFKDYYVKHDNSNAEKALRACLAKVDTSMHMYAGAQLCMSLFYNEFNGGRERDEKLKYMIIAAISDIQSATMENLALTSLSNTLFITGDIKRAYKYTHYALDDANFYNARYRNFQIGKMLPIIEKAYEEESVKQRNRMRAALVIISCLVVGLLITVFLIRKQMISLAQARKKLDMMNEDLKNANQQLNNINTELSDANRIKEFYVGHFFDLCSTYIGKIEDYQKSLKKRTILKKGLQDSPSDIIQEAVVETELKDFYHSFDKAFLTIFPDFVEKFNELMPEKEKILPKPNEGLSTELRIFALIRLGISDSNRIASLLRYSLTTIYTYRSRIKNKSGYPNDFEKRIMQIGTF